MTPPDDVVLLDCDNTLLDNDLVQDGFAYELYEQRGRHEGPTSNSTIFDHAIKNGDLYDDAIHRKTAEGKSGETLFFELAIEDLVRAADLFRLVHDRTGGVDGWVSLEVSPLLANELRKRWGRPNRSPSVFGKTAREVEREGTRVWLVPHRVFEENRPTTTILADRLTPETLGSLVALYEHSVFTQGVIWGIDSFDQWGVELGKAQAQRIGGELQGDGPSADGHDSSTTALMWRYMQSRNGSAR